MEKYKPFILKAFQIIKNRDNPTTKAVRIHGEIFGGAYPHKDVKPIPVMTVTNINLLNIPLGGNKSSSWSLL